MCWMQLINDCPSFGLALLTWARILCWVASNWFMPETKLPRSKEAPAALSDARMGRLFLRRMFVVSTRVMQRSTASEGAIAHTISVAVQLSVPSEPVRVIGTGGGGRGEIGLNGVVTRSRGGWLEVDWGTRSARNTEGIGGGAVFHESDLDSRRERSAFVVPTEGRPAIIHRHHGDIGIAT